MELMPDNILLHIFGLVNKEADCFSVCKRFNLVLKPYQLCWNSTKSRVNLEKLVSQPLLFNYWWVYFPKHDNSVSECLFKSCENGYLKIVEHILDSPQGTKILVPAHLETAVQNGNYDIVELLISRCISSKTKDMVLTSCLPKLSSDGKFSYINSFISIGADLGEVSDRCLYEACKQNHIETVKYLISQNVDITMNSNEAFRIALDRKYGHLIVLLVQNGAIFEPAPSCYT